MDRSYVDANYHSDQIGFLAEGFHLFGFGFSIIWFFAIGVMFRSLDRMVVRLVHFPFYKTVFRGLWLSVFWVFLQSFGLITR